METIPGVYPLRGWMGLFHLLADADGAVLLDTGLWGEMPALRWRLRKLGLGRQDIRAILLTHGHLDHTGNLAAIREWTGAPVYAHPLEESHIRGLHPYTGLSRWCGRLEAVGRTVLRYRPGGIDVALQDGEILPFWGGLRVVHLPGHTAGHSGFYSEKHDLLFSGDLFASYFFNVHLPPAILNTHPEQIKDSLKKARALNARRMLPNHYDFTDGRLHRRRFEKLIQRVL
jgi:glyoxylase-like metal-dependent hydrolase (beta-lactamase superfamily II)